MEGTAPGGLDGEEPIAVAAYGTVIARLELRDERVQERSRSTWVPTGRGSSPAGSPVLAARFLEVLDDQLSERLRKRVQRERDPNAIVLTREFEDGGRTDCSAGTPLGPGQARSGRSGSP